MQLKAKGALDGHDRSRCQRLIPPVRARGLQLEAREAPLAGRQPSVEVDMSDASKGPDTVHDASKIQSTQTAASKLLGAAEALGRQPTTRR
jgi:hypothetical protein